MPDCLRRYGQSRLGGYLDAALVRHLEEQQVGQLLDVVAVVDAIVTQGVAEAPEFVDDIGHAATSSSLSSRAVRRVCPSNARFARPHPPRSASTGMSSKSSGSMDRFCDQVLADVLHPLDLVLGESAARGHRRDSGIDSFLGGEQRRCLGGRPLHHRDDVHQRLVVGDLEGPLQVRLREVLRAWLSFSRSSRERLGAPLRRPRQQDSDGPISSACSAMNRSNSWR